MNVTETCAEDDLHLITSVQVAPNITADNSFVEAAIETTEKVMETKVTQMVSDGAYHSVENDVYAQERGDLDMLYTGFQGKSPRFELIETGTDLLAKDSISGELHHCFPVRKSKRSKKELQRRNNVEATMFLFGWGLWWSLSCGALSLS